jgi:hypothetical protein
MDCTESASPAFVSLRCRQGDRKEAVGFGRCSHFENPETAIPDRVVQGKKVTSSYGLSPTLIARLPVDLTGYGLDVLAGTAVAEFNCQNLTSEDDGYAMERVAMPTCRLARREKQPSYECGSTLVKGLLDHSVLHLPSGDFPTSAVNVQSQINKNRTTSIAVWKSHPPLYSFTANTSSLSPFRKRRSRGIPGRSFRY